MYKFSIHFYTAWNQNCCNDTYSPNIINKILTDRQRSVFKLMDINLLDFISMKLFLVEQFQISLVYFSHNQVVWYNKIFYGSWSRVLNNGKLFSSKIQFVSISKKCILFIFHLMSLFTLSLFPISASNNLRTCDEEISMSVRHPVINN